LPFRIPFPSSKKEVQYRYKYLTHNLRPKAGYQVITTTSPRNFDLLTSLSASIHVYDYHSPTIVTDLLSSGPYTAVFSGTDTVRDQEVIGQILAAQGGGEFLATMGLRPGAKLPEGVKALFAQYLDDYLKKENREFMRWMFGEFLEEGFRDGRLRLGRTEVVGGLGAVHGALERLRGGGVSGVKLVIMPHV
jgi:hypothetical protein